MCAVKVCAEVATPAANRQNTAPIMRLTISAQLLSEHRRTEDRFDSFVNKRLYFVIPRISFDCSIVLETVTSLFNSTARRRPSLFGRGLASVLLVLLVYGATVEAVHSHGGLVPAHEREARAVTQTNDSDLSSRQTSSHGDCLICQLHQNLANGLFQAQSFALRPLTATAATSALVACYYSHMDTPRRGRAPPLTSLL